MTTESGCFLLLELEVSELLAESPGAMLPQPAAISMMVFAASL